MFAILSCVESLMYGFSLFIDMCVSMFVLLSIRKKFGDHCRILNGLEYGAFNGFPIRVTIQTLLQCLPFVRVISFISRMGF